MTCLRVLQLVLSCSFKALLVVGWATSSGSGVLELRISQVISHWSTGRINSSPTHFWRIKSKGLFVHLGSLCRRSHIILIHRRRLSPSFVCIRPIPSESTRLRIIWGWWLELLIASRESMRLLSILKTIRHMTKVLHFGATPTWVRRWFRILKVRRILRPKQRLASVMRSCIRCGRKRIPWLSSLNFISCLHTYVVTMSSVLTIFFLIRFCASIL